jgi:DNA gyrase/topoisomerase IV subunit B
LNNTVKIKEIQRNKGLGEMSPEAFKHTLNREEFTKINVENMTTAKHMLDVCFGKDTNLRKELLLDDESKGKLSADAEEEPIKKAAKKTTKKSLAKVLKTTTKKKK